MAQGPVCTHEVLNLGHVNIHKIFGRQKKSFSFLEDFREENMLPNVFILYCLFLKTKQGSNERRKQKKINKDLA
jgi:hypothetical protein